MKRRTSEAVKKIVAARAKWRCEKCAEMLPAAYEIDHKVPLWRGGEDAEPNLQALCNNCHGAKTQRESMQRAEEAAKKRRRRERRQRKRENEAAVRDALAHEQMVRQRERPETTRLAPGLMRCEGCGTRYHEMFGHRVCQEHERRVKEALEGRERKEALQKALGVLTSPDPDHDDNPFRRFRRV